MTAPNETTWAAKLEACEPERLAARLGPLRLRPGLEACVDPEGLTWLRGGALDPALERALRAVPGATRFVVDAAGEVRAPDRRLPAGRLPRGPWRSLRALLAPATPPARDPPVTTARAALRLTRGAAPDDAEPGLLACALADLVRWAVAAPLVRLDPLEVACAGELALVRGRPLPPLPGERFALAGGVAVPCGLVVAPALDAATLEAALDLAPGDLALLREGEGGAVACERVPAAAFQPASRALARALRA